MQIHAGASLVAQLLHADTAMDRISHRLVYQ